MEGAQSSSHNCAGEEAMIRVRMRGMRKTLVLVRLIAGGRTRDSIHGLLGVEKGGAGKRNGKGRYLRQRHGRDPRSAIQIGD